MANLSGWIIHKKSLGENFEVDRLVEEFEKQGVDIRVVNPKDVDIFVDRDDRKSIIVDGKPRKLPDFVLPRTGSGTTYFIKDTGTLPTGDVNEQVKKNDQEIFEVERIVVNKKYKQLKDFVKSNI